MDTSDPSIQFTEEGICDNCIQFELVTKQFWEKKQKNKDEFRKTINQIKSNKRKNIIVFWVLVEELIAHICFTML